MTWNWQSPDWPNFRWARSQISAAEEQFLLGAGVAIGTVKHPGEDESNGIASSFQCYPDAMQFIVELPDDIARQMIPAGRDPARAALEDMAVEAYRSHRLTEHQLATLLGMDRNELDGFLKQREVWLEYTTDELRQELEVGERLWQKRQDEFAASGQ